MKQATIEKIAHLKAEYLAQKAKRSKAETEKDSLSWRIADDTMNALKQALARIIFEDKQA